MKRRKQFKLIFKPYDKRKKEITAIAFTKEGLSNLIDMLKKQAFLKKQMESFIQRQIIKIIK